MTIKDKYTNLIADLKRMKKVVIAFSGGVDSTFLLKAAQEALGDKVKAVTILSPYIPQWEVAEAKDFAQKIGVAHTIIEVPIIAEIRYNPQNRCYLCKKAVFQMIKELAQDEGYSYVIDGTNFDDLGDYRPGLKALQELNIKNPLFECKLTKEEIRSLSKELGLSTWDKPPYACLLTRLPYGDEVKADDLIKIEQAEKFMMSLGFRAVRIRCHRNLARIEVAKKDRKKLFDEDLLDQVAAKLKEQGFQYVTMDLEGYRVGSFNEVLTRGL
ncbi:ATP-dependent sacrificial sulfur transferase LarE [Bacillota bacterium LX-D]|nr:ATP-dependent sacrificial sulfur transferase LarE [Bacillota bacterium LX-D]